MILPLISFVVLNIFFLSKSTTGIRLPSIWSIWKDMSTWRLIRICLNCRNILFVSIRLNIWRASVVIWHLRNWGGWRISLLNCNERSDGRSICSFSAAIPGCAFPILSIYDRIIFIWSMISYGWSIHRSRRMWTSGFLCFCYSTEKLLLFMNAIASVIQERCLEFLFRQTRMWINSWKGFAGWRK